MGKRLNCSVIFTPIAIILQIVVICGLAILLRAGSSMSYLHIALIDTHDYKTAVNGRTYAGLPDPHDFSKNKDIFWLYPALYCSGNEVKGSWNADFCSSWGSQFFDLQRVWRVWGVDLIDQNVIGTTPKIIFIGLMIACASVAVSVAFGLLTCCCSFWGAVVATILSWLSACFVIATAALSQIFVDKLTSSLKDLKLSGSGEIVAQRGVWYGYTVWICGIVALLASILWTVIVWRNRKRRASKSARSNGPIPLVGKGGLFGQKKAEETTSYEHLASEPDLYKRGSVTSRDSAYEPMRHQSVGY